MPATRSLRVPRHPDDYTDTVRRDRSSGCTDLPIDLGVAFGAPAFLDVIESESDGISCVITRGSWQLPQSRF